jgi:hypothetical protein
MADIGDRSGVRTRRAVVSLLLALLGLRTFYLFVGHLNGETLRPRVETSAVWFVLAVLVLLATKRPHGKPTNPAAVSAIPVPGPVLWLFFAGAAFVAYWPTLSIGLLSDDFLLWDRAERWDVSPVSAGLFRPLPLVLWGMLINAGASAAALHVLNVALHGTNAWLTSRLAAGWIGGGPAPIVAGGLMLVFPLATEPVSWPSGVFDLSMTALVLLLVLRGRLYEKPLGPAPRAGFVAIGLLAMAAKETGVMAVALVLIDAWIRRIRSRQLVSDAVAVLAIAAAFAAIRIIGSVGVRAPSLTRYRVQRSLFETFGGLAVPFHSDVIQQLPSIPIAAVLILIALLVTYAVTAGNRADRFVFGAGAWIVASVLPVFLFVFVAADLQGARFLYLASPAWASLIAAIAFSTAGVVSRWLLLTAVALLMLWGISSRVHLGAWREAAAARDRVVAAAKSDRALRACGTVTLKLPDNVRGAYVFRNGAPEALLREASLRVTDAADAACRFVWNDGTRTFSRAPE